MTDHRGDDEDRSFKQLRTWDKKRNKKEKEKMKQNNVEPVQPTVRTADLAASLAANLFAALNPMEVEFMRYHPFNQDAFPATGVIITDADPESLYYPEGWYFAKGNFRNKYNTTSGVYEEVPMLKSDGTPW